VAHPDPAPLIERHTGPTGCLPLLSGMILLEETVEAS
jgi:hypothetical protein